MSFKTGRLSLKLKSNFFSVTTKLQVSLKNWRQFLFLDRNTISSNFSEAKQKAEAAWQHFGNSVGSAENRVMGWLSRVRSQMTQKFRNARTKILIRNRKRSAHRRCFPSLPSCHNVGPSQLARIITFCSLGKKLFYTFFKTDDLFCK